MSPSSSLGSTVAFTPTEGTTSAPFTLLRERIIPSRPGASDTATSTRVTPYTLVASVILSATAWRKIEAKR